MQVQVPDYLPTMFSAVDYQSIAAFLDTFLFCQSVRYFYHLTGERKIFFRNISDCFHVFDRNDQQMSRRDRINITECYNVIVTIDNISGNVTGGNFAEDAVFHFQLQ